MLIAHKEFQWKAFIPVTWNTHFDALFIVWQRLASSIDIIYADFLKWNGHVLPLLLSVDFALSFELFFNVVQFMSFL